MKGKRFRTILLLLALIASPDVRFAAGESYAQGGMPARVQSTDTIAQVDNTAVTGADAEASPGGEYRLSALQQSIISLPRTGQTTSYHPGDDGDVQAGVAWPAPRFIDNGDGTVTDNLTGLMWLKDANCAHTIGHDPDGSGDGGMSWESSLDFVAGIISSTHDIAACASYSADYDDWRLPNIFYQRKIGFLHYSLHYLVTISWRKY